MQIGFRHFWEVKVNDYVDSLNVNTTSEKVRTDQIATKAGPEIMENPITVSLGHFGVNIVTTVSQFSDFFGQKFHTLGRITKDDALVYLKFGEKRVETMNLLTLLYESVILRYAL